MNLLPTNIEERLR